MDNQDTFTTFRGNQLIVSGDVRTMLVRTKELVDSNTEDAAILIFEDRTGCQVDFDFRGTVEEVLGRIESHPLLRVQGANEEQVRSGPGRPRLGVVCREVSLLPRHWEWLERQPGGLSATLRRLVDEERRRGLGSERVRMARDAVNKFLWAMAGNLPRFEEATRALYAGDMQCFKEQMRDWPAEIQGYVIALLERAVVE